MHSHDRTLLTKLGFQDKDKGDPRHDLACQYLKQLEVAERLVGMMYPNALKLGTLLNSQEFASVDELISLLSANKWNGLIGESKIRTVNAIKDSFHFHRCKVLKSWAEKHIKGDGQYATTIGFADLVFTWEAIYRYFGYEETWMLRGTRETYGRTVEFDATEEEAKYYRTVTQERYLKVDFRYGHTQDRYANIVEVKINPVSVGDIIRQINLYRQWLPVVDRSRCNKAVALACAFPLLPYEIKALRDENIVYIPLGKNFERWCEEQTRGANSTATPDI